VRQRTLTQREKIETSEIEQNAKHGFENDGSEHIVGIYRWLERCFDLHLVNYGRRLIYEFVVPEPASYWAALVEARGDAKSGPPPLFPQLVRENDNTRTRALEPNDFDFVKDGKLLDVPARWADIVKLAGEWGVGAGEEPEGPRRGRSRGYAVDALSRASGRARHDREPNGRVRAGPTAEHVGFLQARSAESQWRFSPECLIRRS